MRIALFCHSILSDWNHGNAHFLRGIVTELERRGHEVRTFEARGAWSVRQLERDHGTEPLDEVRKIYPRLRVERYASPDTLDVDAALHGAHLVLVHEWTPPSLVSELGKRRAGGGGFKLLFHDTHHRATSAADELAACDLSAFDGVLAFGESLREQYLKRGWAHRVWTWHEAADVRLFRPPEASVARREGLVWIGNWGDDERSAELREYLIEPVARLRLPTVVHGVRYPEAAKAILAQAGIQFRGWLPNYRVPEVFARHAMTIHVPRRPYAQALKGIPTIRPFEALACGIPLVSAPWDDAEGLFRAGRDYLLARDGKDMQRHLRDLQQDSDRARELARHGLETIRARHTCAHRVDALLDICAELGLDDERTPSTPALGSL